MCLRRIGLFLFEFLTTERDCKFAVIRIFNNRKWFFDEIEIYSIINLTLEYVLAIYIASLLYFRMLTHLLIMQPFSTPWKPFSTPFSTVFWCFQEVEKGCIGKNWQIFYTFLISSYFAVISNKSQKMRSSYNICQITVGKMQ